MNKNQKLQQFVYQDFFGFFWADWFYLSAGYSGYIVGGVFKFLTGGGCGLWWLIDWINIAANAFPDGQDVPLA
jgi:hypothetical protein